MANPQNGSGYVNLSQIINANANNQLGSTVQQGVQQGVNNLNTNLQQSQNQFNQQNQANNLNTTQNQQSLANTIGGITNAQIPQAQTTPQPVTSSSTAPASTTQPTTSTGSTATPAQPAPTQASGGSSTTSTPAASTTPAATNVNAAPGSFGASTQTPYGVSAPNSGANQVTQTQQGYVSPTAGQQSQIAQYLQGAYNGPNQLQNYANLQAQAQNLQQQGQQVNTAGGLQSLLQQYVGGPQYNQGEQALDAVLLGQTDKQNLQNVVNATQGLTNVPQTAEANAAAQAAATAAGNQQFAQSTAGQIQSAENGILQNIQTQANTQNATNTTNLGVAGEIYKLLSGQTPNNGVPLASAPLSTMTSAPGATGNGVNLGPGIAGSLPAGWGYSGGAAPGFQWNPQTGAVYSPIQIQNANNQMANLKNALNLAQQNGLLTTPGETQNLQNYLMSQSLAGVNPATDLSSVLGNYNPTETLPTNSLQQTATLQQAAQLNALQQLAGQTPGYTTYGDATTVAPTFNLGNVNGFNTSQNYVNPLAGLTPYSGGTIWIPD